jgi:hypothetical protein
MSNRQVKTVYEFTNYKPISVHKKVYDELTDLSNNIYDIKLSYAKTIEHLINYYKENKIKKNKMIKTINIKTIKGLKLFKKYIKLNWSTEGYLMNKKRPDFIVIKSF